MRLDVTSIVEAALQLPEDDRLAIVSRLLETVSADQASLAFDDPHLIDELDRRMSDTASAMPWSELREKS